MIGFNQHSHGTAAGYGIPALVSNLPSFSSPVHLGPDWFSAPGSLARATHPGPCWPGSRGTTSSCLVHVSPQLGQPEQLIGYTFNQPIQSLLFAWKLAPTLAPASRQPGSPRATNFHVPPEPGSWKPFAPPEPGSLPHTGIQTALNCTPWKPINPQASPDLPCVFPILRATCSLEREKNSYTRNATILYSYTRIRCTSKVLTFKPRPEVKRSIIYFLIQSVNGLMLWPIGHPCWAEKWSNFSSSAAKTRTQRNSERATGLLDEAPDIMPAHGKGGSVVQLVRPMTSPWAMLEQHRITKQFFFSFWILV